MSEARAVAGSAEHPQNIPLGIGLMLLAILLFAGNDALGKYLAGTYFAGQILFFRSIAAALILLPFAIRAGFRSIVTVEKPWLQVLRVCLSGAETFCFYAAVSVLPLADAMTYYLAGPIYATVLAAVLLKERVGWRRWTAVLVGFVGVVIALGPSASSFGGWALVALLGSFLYACFLVITRSLRGTPDTTMAIWQTCSALVIGAFTAPLSWTPLASTDDLLLIMLLGIVSLGAIVCVNRSLKYAPASVVVPYQYMMIVWAVIFGYIFFSDVPSIQMLIGAVIIVGAGLFIFFREQQVEHRTEPEILTGP